MRTFDQLGQCENVGSLSQIWIPEEDGKGAISELNKMERKSCPMKNVAGL